MPINVTKVLGGEKKWRKAKQAAGKRFGKSDRHWRLVNSIFQKMKKA